MIYDIHLTNSIYIMDTTRMAKDLFNKMADVYQQKFMNVDKYADTLNMFCEAVKQDAKVLDAACGPGNVTRYLLDKQPSWKILGIDIAEQMLALAKQNNPEAAFQIMDCRDIGKLNERFDAVICAFGLPYLSKQDALQFINDSYAILNPGGVLYISTMTDDYSKSGIDVSSSGDELYIYYHEADYLTDELKRLNFEPLCVQVSEYHHDNGKTYNDLVLIAKKG